MIKRILEFTRKHQIMLLTILAAIIGAIAFVCIYGVEVLATKNTLWLENAGDLTQHYTGWTFFRSSDWNFQIGLFNSLSYPNYASIIFTDSIPLFAVFFKIISNILPETFQYMGIFGIICYILQGVFSFTLLRKFIENKFYAIIRKCIFCTFTLYVI